MTFFKFIAYLIYLTLIAAFLWCAALAYNFLTTPFAVPKEGTIIMVEPGDSITKVAYQLEQEKILTQPKLFILLARFRGKVDKIRVGEYAIMPGMGPNQLLDILIEGKIFKRKITFIEGWTFNQMRKRLAATPYISQTTLDKTNTQVMQALGFGEKDPEGLFYPDTYFYTRGDADLVVLDKAYRAMQRVLTKNWDDRDVSVPYENAYEALIIASLIEHETALDNERPQIAGVILNRLKKGMRLQIDPTVLYGVGKSYGAPITKSDLRNDNAYNTYRRKGLPPTPIGMPRAASIYAALHPAHTDALYYVAKGGGKSHHFSTTYKQHQQYVSEYRSWYKSYQEKKAAELRQVLTSKKESLEPCYIDLCAWHLPLITPFYRCDTKAELVGTRFNVMVLSLLNPMVYFESWIMQEVLQQFVLSTHYQDKGQNKKEVDNE